MDVVALGLVPASRGLFPAQVSVLDEWLAVSCGRLIRLWKTKDKFKTENGNLAEHVTSLQGMHAHEVSAVHLCKVKDGNSIYLLSASKDCVVVWKNPQFHSNGNAEGDDDGDHQQADGHAKSPIASVSEFPSSSLHNSQVNQIAEGDFQNILDVTLSPRGIFASLATGNEVVIIKMASATKATLCGHNGHVIQTSFLPFSTSHFRLVSISTDVTLRLWDIQSMTCLRIWDSAFCQSSPLSCITITSSNEFHEANYMIRGTC
jgi:WD40 repeat protein